MEEKVQFVSALENVLPALKQPFDLIHAYTIPKPCRALVYRGKRRERTDNLDMAAPHYFILSYDGLDILGLDVMIYESPDICTLFVGKADTTGHFYEQGLSVRDVVTAILRDLLRHYVRHDKLVRFCLFAKAEGQYLFPLSKDNPRKHLLTDGQLIKWWVAVMDDLSDEFQPAARATLQMPGANEQDIKVYLSKVKAKTLNWEVGHIFAPSSGEASKPAVYYIPRFPDDPKRRFLDFLIGERRIKDVSLQQFWLELQSRQEFRLGRAVGILAIEGHLRDCAKLGSQTSPVSYKMMEKLKDCCMSSNYSTRVGAADAHNEVYALVPESSVLSIRGSKVPQAREAKTSASPAVNVLSSTLVRKKR